VKTFKHSGDMGDIIYSLPTIRALGGGKLYLDVEGGHSSPPVRMMTDAVGRDRLKFDRDCYEFLWPLLLRQPYIESVEIWDKGIPVDIDLDTMRVTMINAVTQPPRQEITIVHAHAKTFGVTVDPATSWLDAGEPLPGDPTDVAVSRSLRYHGNYSYWERIRPHISKFKTVFVGTGLEYDCFEECFGYGLPYIQTLTAWELAQVINSAKEFIGNQCLAMAIAIGLGKKKFVQEVYPRSPNCKFEFGVYV